MNFNLVRYLSFIIFNLFIHILYDLNHKRLTAL